MVITNYVNYKRASENVDYKRLWNEETQLVEQLQADKDFMDLQLMKALDLIRFYPMDNPFKATLETLIKKARARV